MKQSTSCASILSFIMLFQFYSFGAEAKLSEKNFEQNQKIIKNSNLILKDISTINLLNGLYLTKAQAQQLKQLAEEFYQAENQWLVSPELSDNLKEREKALSDLRKEIQKGVPAREEIPDAAKAQHEKYKKYKIEHDKNLKSIYESFNERLNALLSQEQLSVVTTFKTCLIPPKDLRDPVRAGQANSSQGTIKKIRTLRAMPPVKWEKRKQNIIAKHVEKESHTKLSMTEKEKSDRVMKIVQIIQKARSMSDTEFELEKEKLAEEMALPDVIDDLKRQITFRTPTVKKPGKSRAMKFLLTKNIISILDNRLSNGLYE